MFASLTIPIIIPLVLMFVLKFVGAAVVRLALNTVYKRDFDNE
jgi:nucleoside recognition membrane protein YjiH